MPHTKFRHYTSLISIFILMSFLLSGYSSLALADDQLFIQSAGAGPMLLVTDIDTMSAVVDIPGTVAGLGYDDGKHMVIDPIGKRIFVADHDSDFAVYDFALNLLSPAWGGALLEPLGLVVLPTGSILVTDEEDGGGAGKEALFRLNPDLSLAASATGTSPGDFDGPEGIAYDAVNNRIYMANEEDNELVVFNGGTLAYIGFVNAGFRFDGPYWLAVDGSSNKLFVLGDSRTTVAMGENFGIHVWTISNGGDTLTFDQTLLGSLGGGASSSTNCVGSIAVSESKNRLFAVDNCANTVSVYDTTSLAKLADVPLARRGSRPVMLAVGHLGAAPLAAVPVPNLSLWNLLFLILVVLMLGGAYFRTNTRE